MNHLVDYIDAIRQRDAELNSLEKERIAEIHQYVTTDKFVFLIIIGDRQNFWVCRYKIPYKRPSSRRMALLTTKGQDITLKDVSAIERFCSSLLFSKSKGQTLFRIFSDSNNSTYRTLVRRNCLVDLPSEPDSRIIISSSLTV